jgi:iron complex transport system substrate-binding protein
VEETGLDMWRSSAPAPHGSRRRFRALARPAHLTLLTVLASCVEAPAPPRATANPVIEVVDDAGRTVRLAAPATRIISLIPAQTEVVTVLGGVERLLARTRWDTDARLAHLPSLGDALTPSVEWIVAQRPDLVIAWTDGDARTIVQRLSAAGVTVYSSRVESLAEIDAMIARIGTLLGRAAAADSLIASIDAQLDSVRTAVAGRARPAVLYLIDEDPAMAAGAGTFVGQLVEVAGGRNVFGDLPQFYPQISLEEILRRDPDLIIRPTTRPGVARLAALRAKPGWRELRAVRDARVHEIDVDLYNRPGITVGRAARGLAQIIHPDAFGTR